MTTLRVVIDTNIWIRILLNGPVTLPILKAFEIDRFDLIVSQPLFDEFHDVWHRPRLYKRINTFRALRLERQIKIRSIWTEITTIPPNCRDPKDLPVLATAIDGKANVIVSGDDDLRSDEVLRAAMNEYNIQLSGVNSFLTRLDESER